ncbi:hypothetical protein ACQKO7_23225, partial [Pseudomonas putida]|uniref:hypothetical protein n=1 Tax=Pseudomonas putida TaxID=303 RepID=UPI003CFFCC6F
IAGLPDNGFGMAGQRIDAGQQNEAKDTLIFVPPARRSISRTPQPQRSKPCRLCSVSPCNPLVAPQ